jgi:hypothetical protein
MITVAGHAMAGSIAAGNPPSRPGRLSAAARLVWGGNEQRQVTQA